jgi:hypothetical protein
VDIPISAIKKYLEMPLYCRHDLAYLSMGFSGWWYSGDVNYIDSISADVISKLINGPNKQNSSFGDCFSRRTDYHLYDPGGELEGSNQLLDIESWQYVDRSSYPTRLVSNTDLWIPSVNEPSFEARISQILSGLNEPSGIIYAFNDDIHEARDQSGRLIGIGESELICYLDLYRKVWEYQHLLCTPSLVDLVGQVDLSNSHNGEPTIDCEDEEAWLSNANKFYRHITNKSSSTYYKGKIELVEGDFHLRRAFSMEIQGREESAPNILRNGLWTKTKKTWI